MNEILLDTHAFLWWALDPKKLPSRLLAMMQNPETRIVFSAVSSWEAQIKIGLGKLTLTEPLRKVVERELVHNNWEVLAIRLEHTWHLAELPPLHKDPFDRLLIAQALAEKLVLVTCDPLVAQYPEVMTMWE